MDLSKEDLVDKDIFKLKICFHISRDIYNKSYPRKIWLLHEDLAPHYKGYISLQTSSR